MEIKVLTKPEVKTTKGGNKQYYFIKALCDGTERLGNFFGDKEPEIDEVIEVEEKFSDKYAVKYSWFQKKDNKRYGASRQMLPPEIQIRIEALKEANITCSPYLERTQERVLQTAKCYEQYLLTGE